VNETLERLVRGQVASGRLPELIDLGELAQGLHDLCRRSVHAPAEEQVEWGACIVLEDGGFYGEARQVRWG
jgi:hypothetical protein